MYRVTGNYTPKCAYNGLDEHFQDFDDAVTFAACYWMLDWVKIERVEVGYNLSEGPYNPLKVDGVGQGSLRGH